ncbi:hypothetical protein [Falsiroseomonas sp. HW251]|uniref:hypothetical protein n=1 Tax=Falsiroseomonas sp. HW251 TaxID=3390998 RepID=UPI003D31359B
MPEPVRLAFAVVYLASPAAMPVVERHLEFVERFAPPGVDWWIEAVAHRANQAFRDRLAAMPRLRLHGPGSIPPVEEKWGSREHAHYLDALVRHAVARGATHLCTLDDDSFPARADWFEVVRARLEEGHAFVATFRAENGDRILPHPSFLATTADFVARTGARFLPEDDPDLLPFLAAHGQTKDTGAGYALAAQRAGRGWARLPRSNAVNDHDIMAGLYGDIAFHFGGANRIRTQTFRRQKRRLDALAPPERRARLEAALAENRRDHEALMARVATDMDAYLAYLRGAGLDGRVQKP